MKIVLKSTNLTDTITQTRSLCESSQLLVAGARNGLPKRSRCSFKSRTDNLAILRWRVRLQRRLAVRFRRTPLLIVEKHQSHIRRVLLAAQLLLRHGSRHRACASSRRRHSSGKLLASATQLLDALTSTACLDLNNTHHTALRERVCQLAHPQCFRAAR